MPLLSWLRKKRSASPAVSRAVSSKRQPTRWQKRFFYWLDKRVPLAKSVLLTSKNLYTFPTFTGFLFLGLSFVLWLLGTSYQNNLILALSYLLISLIVVAIFHTYANLSGLEIKVLGCKPVFVGEQAHFILQLKAIGDKGCDNLMIRWWNGEEACFDFQGNNSTQITVSLVADQRGYLKPGRLLIESSYPLGIIRCWSWLNLDTHALIFPKPLKVPLPAQLLGASDNDSEQGKQLLTGGDFAGLKEYRPGDPIKHIAWKHYAREQGLYSKEYATAQQSDNYLNWDDFMHLNTEDRLRALCYWILQFERAGMAYGLRMPNEHFSPALNDSHRLHLLSTLALFDINQRGQ